MNSINKDSRSVSYEELPSNNEKFLETVILEKEIKEYNAEIYKIAKSNKINFHNESSFIMRIKKQILNRELLPLVLCFLCDSNYVNKVNGNNLDLIEKGDIAAYVVLKTNIEKFLDEIKSIQDNEMLKTSDDTDIFNKLEALVAETYERCNCIFINREQHRVLDLNEGRYIRNFIYDNLKFKTIDHKIYMKKLSEGREEAEEYLRFITKKFLRFNEEEYIKEVEHVSEFYNLLEKILNEEMNKEVETIISEFIYNVIFRRK